MTAHTHCKYGSVIISKCLTYHGEIRFSRTELGFSVIPAKDASGSPSFHFPLAATEMSLLYLLMNCSSILVSIWNLFLQALTILVKGCRVIIKEVVFSNFLRSDNRPALDQSLALTRKKIRFILRHFYQLSPKRGLCEMPLQLSNLLIQYAFYYLLVW